MCVCVCVWGGGGGGGGGAAGGGGVRIMFRLNKFCSRKGNNRDTCAIEQPTDNIGVIFSFIKRAYTSIIETQMINKIKLKKGTEED